MLWRAHHATLIFAHEGAVMQDSQTQKSFFWSYSSLSQFETCPKQWYHVRWARDVVDTPHEANAWGNEAHKHLELAIKGEADVPDSLATLRPVVAQLRAIPGIEAEREYALTEDFKPCKWRSRDAWLRAKIDVYARQGSHALLLDWKFGKRRPGSDQLRLSAAVVMTMDKDIKTVDTGYVWFKDGGKVDSERVESGQLMELWGGFLGRVGRMKAAVAEGVFQPIPSGLCRGWCPVGKERCTFCEG